MVSCGTFIPCDCYRRYVLVIGIRNKQQRQLEALAWESRDLLSNNKYFDIFYDKLDSGNDVLEINMNSFRLVIHSNLNNFPLYYYGDSNSTNLCRRSDISKAENFIGQDLFAAWVIPNPDYSK